MIDYDDPRKLWVQIDASERFRDRHVLKWKQRIRRFHGDAFMSGAEPKTWEDWRELFYHKYLSLIVPRIVGRAPRIAAESSLPEMFAATANGLEKAGNRWIELTRANLTFKELAYDYLLLWAVSVQSRSVVVGGETDDPWSWPAMTRLPPDWWFCHAHAHSKEKARMQGHQWVIDKDDLCDLAKMEGEEQGWDVLACETIKPMSGEDYRKIGRIPNVDLEIQEVMPRDIWFPEVLWESEEEDVAKGINGGTMTVAYGRDAGALVLRKMRPFYGPRSGPYSLYGYHKVPGDPYPLSPLVAVETSIEQVNRQRCRSLDSMAAYKRMVLVGGPNPALAQKIKDNPDLHVFYAGANFEKSRMEAVEQGGLTEQTITGENRERDELERSSGLTEQEQGNVEGIGTATEVNAANMASSVRMIGIQGGFSDGQEDSLRGVCWFLMFDDTVVVPLGEDAQTEETPNPVWQGGVEGEQAAALSKFQDPFDAIQVSVKPFSTEPVTQQQRVRNADTAYELLITAGGTLPMAANAGVDVRTVLHHIGEARGMEWLEKCIDYEQLAKAAQAAEQAENPAFQSRLLRGVMGMPSKISKPANRPQQGAGRTVAPSAKPAAKPGGMPASSAQKPKAGAAA